MDTQKKGNRIQWMTVYSCVTASLGTFISGMQFGWVTPTVALLQSNDTSITPIFITNEQISWIASSLSIGTVFSTILGALIAKFYGTKLCIVVSSLPFIISSIAIVFIRTWFLICLARFVAGLATGLVFTAAPIYIAEVSETHNRGVFMVLMMWSLTAGGLFSVCVGPYVSIADMAYIMLSFPILMLFCSLFSAESPLFYLRMKREEDAMASLSKLRSNKPKEEVVEEFERLKKEPRKDTPILVSIKCLFIKPTPKALLISFAVIAAQQLGGALAVMSYLNQFFVQVKMPHAETLIIAINVISIMFTVVPISLADRWGRKPLLVYSAVGTILGNIMLAIFFFIKTDFNDLSSSSHIILVVLLLFMCISFSCGLSSLPPSLPGELLPEEAKELGVCMVALFASVMTVISLKLYQIIVDSLGYSAIYLIFAALAATFITLFAILFPETAKKSLKEIQDEMNGISMKEVSPAKTA